MTGDYDNPVMIDGFPRSHRVDRWTPGERAINEALQVVESLGSDVLLTDAVVLLGDAQKKVAEYIDRQIQWDDCDIAHATCPDCGERSSVSRVELRVFKDSEFLLEGCGHFVNKDLVAALVRVDDLTSDIDQLVEMVESRDRMLAIYDAQKVSAKIHVPSAENPG
jgi:hypothetical protein